MRNAENTTESDKQLNVYFLRGEFIDVKEAVWAPANLPFSSRGNRLCPERERTLIVFRAENVLA
jgi:hypothetical protein